MIHAEHYRKAYRDIIAVSDLSFEVAPGQILGLVGPNGAGKTTTLRAIAGIIPPTDGRITVAGHDIAEAPIAAKQCLAYVPDDPRLFEVLTVWEHMIFTAKAYGVVDFEERAEALLREFDLEEKRKSIAQDLSRGMRQKVAICCAYLHSPKAILFDEPLTGLDPRAIRSMKTSVRARAEEGASVIISSHLLSLVEDMCTHLLILHKGEALFHGPMADARSAFHDLPDAASLEDVFFHATEGSGPREPVE